MADRVQEGGQRRPTLESKRPDEIGPRRKSTTLWVRGSSSVGALPAQPAEVGFKGLPPHWPVWPRDTKGCGGHGGALSPGARAPLAPARVVSCDELTPAPTPPAAGCSGYADALGAKSQHRSAKFSLSPSPTDLSHPQAQARRQSPGPSSGSGTTGPGLGVPRAN